MHLTLVWGIQHFGVQNTHAQCTQPLACRGINVPAGFNNAPTSQRLRLSRC